MHRPRAAKGEQAEVTRGQPAADGDLAHRIGHVVRHESHDPFGRLLKAHAQGLGHAARHRLGGQIGLDLESQVCERIRTDAPEHQVGIGDGGLPATASIAGRAGPRAGALRTDPQGPAELHPRQGAATGADGVHLQHGHQHGQPVDVRVGGQAHVAVDDQTHVAARAAHVEADHVGITQPTSHLRRADRAARRTGQQRLYRPGLGHGRVHDAAVALHHVERAAIPAPGQLALEILQVGGDQRLQVGVHDHGAGALVLAPFPTHFVRERDAHPIHVLFEDSLDPQLMRRIRIGVQGANRHRAHPALRERPRRCLNLRRVERNEHLAERVDPLVDLEHQVPLHERSRLLVDVAVHIGLIHAADRVDVAKAPRGHQPGRGALFLENDVETDGGAVNEEGDLGKLDAGARQARQDAVREGLGARGRLGHPQRPRLMVEQHEIGEGAADVHGQALAHVGAASCSGSE